MAPEEYGTDLHTYFELRTFLDSLQIGALRLYLDAKPGAQQEEIFNKLKSDIKPIAEYVWTAARAAADAPGTCPDGYVECYGCCVPYACVG